MRDTTCQHGVEPLLMNLPLEKLLILMGYSHSINMQRVPLRVMLGVLFGVCGFNSFCTLGGDQRSSCQCPKWYSLLDPNHPYGSSKLDFIQGCAEDELIGRKEDVAEYDFEVLINTDWPLLDYVLLKPFTEEQCKQSCLEDWMCAVTIFRSGNSCFKKKLPLSNG